MQRQSVSAFPHGGLRFRAAPWWLAAPGAADGAEGATSAGATPRSSALQRPTVTPSARYRRDPRPS